MRRLLLISYHFPPSEAAGALRWQRLAQIAANHGWEIDAVTLGPGLADRIDWTRVNELPPSTRIHGVPYPEPLTGRLELLAWRIWRALQNRSKKAEPSQRPNTLLRTEASWVGDPRAFRRMVNVWLDYARESTWRKEAVKAGLRVARERRPDLVVSCGPPNRVHEAGRRIAKRSGVPFVMDMRDPWSTQHRMHEAVASPLFFRFADWEEGRCAREAALIVMNTPVAAAAMQAKRPDRTVMSVLNGWDEEPVPQLPWPDQFRVVYAGTVYIDRNPRSFFRAVRQAVDRLAIGPEEFQVRLIGGVESFDGQSVETLATLEGVADLVQVIPPLPRREVLEEYAQAAVLLSLPQDAHHAIPSKIYEYMRQPSWVLAQTSPESATGMVLRDTSALVIQPDDVESTCEALVECYGRFREGHRPEPIANGGRFSRASEGGRLFAALEALVGNDGGTA